jgi:hypothetical protein
LLAESGSSLGLEEWSHAVFSQCPHMVEITWVYCYFGAFPKEGLETLAVTCDAAEYSVLMIVCQVARCLLHFP